jgi:type IV secretion system protein TrbJ
MMMLKKITVKYMMIVSIFLVIWMSTSQAMLVHDPFTYLKTVLLVKNSANSLLKQADQIKNQFNMIKNQAKDLKRLPKFKLREISSLLNKLDAITQESESISYSMTHWDRQFRKLYPDYGKSEYGHDNYQTMYRQWQTGTLNTLRNSIGAANKIAANAVIEQEQLQDIKNHAKNAQGNMQILQTSTELAVENIQQLQTLKRIILAQMNSQNAYMANQVSQQSYEQEKLAEIINEIPSEFPEYYENPAFGKIEMME